MFLLMGYFCFHAGLTEGLFQAARVWLSKLPGGLAVATIAGCAGFAAVTGSSVACAAAMGRIAIPEMLKSKYAPDLAAGAAAAGGTIGSMIPPSIIMILFGIFAEVPISKMFIGGILPGLLTALMYSIVIVSRATVVPKVAPLYKVDVPMSEKLAALKDTWPVLLLIFSVFGGLFGGVFTATEAGARGAFVAFVIAAIKGKLTWTALKAAVVETLTTTAAVFVIAIGANLLTRFMALSGASDFMATLVVSWGIDPLPLIILISLLYLFLGCFLDPIGIMLLTLPVLLPILESINVSLIWFGVLLTKYLEVGLLTPPVGLNVFVIKGVVGDAISLEKIFRGVMWFIMADCITVAFMIAFPPIVTWLPSLLD
jgi:tripartite ATP-independent transporter DctM subunit